MHAPLKAFFLLVLCAGVGLVLTGGRISTPQPASIRMPILPPEWTAPDETVSDVVAFEGESREILEETNSADISCPGECLFDLSNALLLLGYFLGGPPMIEPDFQIQTSQKLQKNDTTTLVICYAPTELKWDNDTVDYDLAKHVAYRLSEHDIRVVDPDRVHAWLGNNKAWHKVAEVGAEFKVDFIVHIDLKDYSLFEEHSADLYRGRAGAMITVIKMDDDKNEGETIYSKEIVSRFPRHAPISVYQQSYDNFKKQYLSNLAEQIGKLFYETESSEATPDSPPNE